jgi:hypothetical protein
MAGAGFKTFAVGEVLTANNVNTYLMQQTVMVFATSAARSSALSTNVAEGMVSYLSDTNVLEKYDGAAWVDITADSIAKGLIDAKGDLIVGTADNTPARLGVGSNGQVLTADSTASTGLAWAAAPGGGALVLITTSSPSNAASASFDNVFTSTYRHYFVQTMLSGAGANLMWRFRASGSDNTTTNYATQKMQARNTTISGVRVTSADEIELGAVRGDISPCNIWVFSPQAAQRSYVQSANSDSLSTVSLELDHGVFADTTQFDGFKIFADSGNITGTINVYGIED